MFRLKIHVSRSSYRLRLGANERASQTNKATIEPDNEPAPKARLGSTKKSAKKKASKRLAARKATGAKPEQERPGADDRLADAAGASAPPTDTPTCNACGTCARRLSSPLQGILPPEFEKLFPYPASRAVSVSAFFAALVAAAGHAGGLPTGMNNEAHDGGVLGIRVAIVSDGVSLSAAVAPVLQAVYSVQAGEGADWAKEKQRENIQAAIIATRQRLYRQTFAHAAMLGLDGLSNSESALDEMPGLSIAERPTFVLRDPASTAVKAALAAGGQVQ